MSQFAGFPKGTFVFLQDLEENNNRDWFAENRERYEENFLQPSLSFIEAIKPKLDQAAPMLKAEAKKTGGSLMRIYKDTRFSKDKTPYKTNIGIHFRHQVGKDVHAPGVYLHVTTSECFLGVGVYRPGSEALSLIRQQIDQQPDEWKKAIGGKRFRENFELLDDRLKTAPRGYPKDHPQLESLRLKSFIGMHPLKRKELTSQGLTDEVIRLVKAAAPVMRYLCAAIGQPY